MPKVAIFAVLAVVGTIALVLVARSLRVTEPETRPTVSASDWAENDYARTRLIAGGDRESPGLAKIGIQIQLEDHWKTYWRSPGPAGVPPQLDWSGSTNAGSKTVLWPVPSRFETFGIQTYGYSGDVVLPVHIQLLDPDHPAQIHLQMNYLVCRDICIPLHAEHVLDISPSEPGAYGELISRFERKVPELAEDGALSLVEFDARQSEHTAELIIQFESGEALARPDVFIEGPVGLDFGKPAVTLTQGGKLARLVVPVDVREGIHLGEQTFVLTLDGGGIAGPLRTVKDVTPSDIP